MAALSRAQSRISTMMIDVDFFKKFNDTYGHAEGDECLKAVAITLSNTVTRKADFVARYGGEEFAVVLPGTDEKGARFVAEKMLASGDYVYTQSWADYQKKADDALYISKNNGRNRYTLLSFQR